MHLDFKILIFIYTIDTHMQMKMWEVILLPCRHGLGVPLVSLPFSTEVLRRWWRFHACFSSLGTFEAKEGPLWARWGQADPKTGALLCLGAVQKVTPAIQRALQWRTLVKFRGGMSPNFRRSQHKASVVGSPCPCPSTSAMMVCWDGDET